MSAKRKHCSAPLSCTVLSKLHISGFRNDGSTVAEVNDEEIELGDSDSDDDQPKEQAIPAAVFGNLGALDRLKKAKTGE